MSSDTPRLREVARAAKGHWGHDEELVRTWAAGIARKGEIEVAELDGTVVAWSAILPSENTSVTRIDL